LTNIELIGNNIRIFRQKSGLSQEQLALQSGMNTSYIGQIERGEKNPTIRTLEKIATTLGISFIDLISSTDLQKGVIRNQDQQYLAILTLEDIKKCIREILKKDSE
jgi:transcriptional regulator with XRE-family HTH domain